MDGCDWTKAKHREDLNEARRKARWPCCLVTITCLLALGFVPAFAAPAEGSIAPGPIPVLAYYYIWFNVDSWDGKKDLPSLGPYSSDDSRVMRLQIEMAKQAGIDGFIVSWKHTAVLDRRLEQLIRIADDQDFKLAIIYQGLDYYRNPLPAATVASDLDYFVQHFATDPVFHIYAKPLVIWSGTWKFSTADIGHVAASRRDSLLILASERSATAYARLSNVVDGDAYYWSSVNPDTFPNYQGKLRDMSNAIHAGAGLWIAPAAPGFDARGVGGTTVVERKDGATFREEMDTAEQSSPDAIGLISWNEYSENSHIEPSRNFGTRYLDILASIVRAPVPNINDFDSSASPATGISYGLPLLGALATIPLGSIVLIVRHARRKNDDASEPDI